jgi:hypothetical protein
LSFNDIIKAGALEAWVRIGRLTASSSTLSTCIRSGILHEVDRPVQYLSSLTIFSSVHIIYLLTTTMWISALLVVQQLSCIYDTNIAFFWLCGVGLLESLNYKRLAQYVEYLSWVHFSTMWALIFVVLNTVWLVTAPYSIPINNILMGIALVCFVDRMKVGVPANSNDLSDAVYYTSLLEYAITTPLLFVVVLAVSSTVATATTFQCMVVCLFISYAASYIALHLQQQSRIQDSFTHLIMLLIGLSTLLMKAAGLTIFLTHAIPSSQSYAPAHSLVYATVWVVTGLDVAFGFLWIATAYVQVNQKPRLFDSYLWVDGIAKNVLAVLIYTAVQQDHIAAHVCVY